MSDGELIPDTARDPMHSPLTHLPRSAGTYSLWHRLASEALVYVSTRAEPSRDTELLNTAEQCATRARGLVQNEMQSELIGKLVEAITRMRTRVVEFPGEN